MALRPVQVNIKARDETALGRFWAEALDWGTSSEAPGVINLEPRGIDWPDPSALCIDLVRIPETATVDYRIHLDLASTSAAHHEQLVTRLTELGATHLDIGQGDVPWTVLADPEGNAFCVLEPRPVYQDTGPVAAVVVHCTDPHPLARFWDAATDWAVHELTADVARLRSAQGVGPYLELVRAPEDSVRTRVHLDLLAYPDDDPAAEVDRLRTLGATDVDLGQGDVPWVCLADPEGNDFCVLGVR